MKGIKEFIEEKTLEEYEDTLFKPDFTGLFLECESKSTDNYISYNDYKKILYKDVFETLSKTYDYSKFKKYLDDHFDNPKLMKDFKNNKLQFALKKIPKLRTKIQQVCDLFGYIITDIQESGDFVKYSFEPIYFNDLSIEVNRMKFLYHCVPIKNGISFDEIKQSFVKKFGLKPSKREILSKHHRRLYYFTENATKKNILDFIKRKESENHFVFIKINLQEYISKLNIKIEWFEDPNMSNAVWTREMIPYKYLDFYEITNINELDEII